MPGKKVLVFIVSLIILASGVFLTYTYSGPVEAKDVLAQGTITVPANGLQSICYTESSFGNYYVQVDANKNTIQAFFNNENSTKAILSNGTIVDIWNLPYKVVFNGSSGEFCNPIIEEKASSEYLFLLNPNSFSEVVSYSVWRSWTYNNYFGMLTGISLISLGMVMLFLVAFKNKLRDFNKALENQE
jgi:hypothetical protein